MDKVRDGIKKQLSIFGKKHKNSHISELNSKEYSHDRVIKSNLVNFDYSKQRIDLDSLEYLLEIPDLINLRQSLKALFKGEIQNPTEDRAVSHTLYRNKISSSNSKAITNERKRIKSFLQKTGVSSSYRNLICLSIGGSRQGPELLNEFQSLNGPMNVYFCSSYDLFELKDLLDKCKQVETIVFVSSKSFETSEILLNLEHVKYWFAQDPNTNLQDHLFAISSNSSAMKKLGIKEDNQFLVLESIGGRFSVWSSLCLPAFVNSSFESYLSFLEGAHLADEHTNMSPWASNIPVLMALLSVWNSNSLKINNHGIFPYSYRLRSLTKYIAQLSMESNGKSVNFESNKSLFNTSPLVWGGYGIESQHSTFQWLMQGKTETSCDFIGINSGEKEAFDSHQMLLSQVLAMTYGFKDKHQPFKSIRGNNPCSILQMESLDLKSLGFLLALYEHKTFIEAIILGIDPFDQWGVELGKKLVLEAKNNKEFLNDFFSVDFIPWQ